MFARLLIGSMVATVMLTSSASFAVAEVVVIVNTRNPVESLSRREAKGRFLKNPSTWRDGTKVYPVDMEVDSPERKQFLTEVLGMSASQLKRYWIARQYATAETPPPTVRKDAAVIEMVGSTTGGIGFISRDALKRYGNANVKVVFALSN